MNLNETIYTFVNKSLEIHVIRSRLHANFHEKDKIMLIPMKISKKHNLISAN